MQTTPFWTDDYPRPDDLGASPLPDHADVAVIGSGYTGLHAALALRAAGASVAVIEAQTIGWGASSRNGGMATSGLKAEMPGVFKRYGPAMGRALWEWAQDAIDLIGRTIDEEQIDSCFERSGCVLLAAKPSHFVVMREAAAWQRRELGFDAGYLVAPGDMHTEIGSTAYFGGLAETTTASLHPARYVFGLAQAAARKGATLVEDAPVTSLLREQGRWRVVTRRGSLIADEVLLATNGYTGTLVTAARQGIFPAGSYVITTEPLAAALQVELSPRGRMFFDSRHFLNYFRLTPDGRMLFGGRHDLSTTLDIEESARRLRARMVELFPQLRDTPLSHTWTGKLGLTFDLMPHIGRAPVSQGSACDGAIWYAYGYAGHGVAIAGKLGSEVGEMIAGVRPHSLFSQIPHRRTWWTPFDRYYLPLVSAWFRTLDRLS